MERWTALLPDRPSTTGAFPLHPKPILHGRLPQEAYFLILQHLPIPDINSFALASKKFLAFSRDDRVWKAKVGWLDYQGPGAIKWKDASTSNASIPNEIPITTTAPLLSTSAGDDDFGDFFAGGTGEEADVSLVHDDGFGDFQDFGGVDDDFGEMSLGGTTTGKKEKGDDLMMLFDDDDDGIPTPTVSKPKPTPIPVRPPPAAAPPPITTALSFLRIFQTHHSLLLPYYLSLLTHTTSSLLFTSPSLSPSSRALILSSLARFVSPLLAPTRSLPQRMTVKRNLQSATDFFESALLAEFERSDNNGDEEGMKAKAEILWELKEGGGGLEENNGGQQGWSVVQVFVQKREIFYDQSHNPSKNLVKIETPTGEKADGIDFSAMDAYMNHVLRVLAREGSLIARVFPPSSDVLIYFLDRLANDVISDYITTLLSDAQSLQQPLFLLATAATFGQVYRLVEATLAIEPKNEVWVTERRTEDVVFRMFESHMDDYLQEEGEWIREVLEGMCLEWDKKTASDLAISDPTFLASQNPAQVKKNVLAGFTKVLLLPVTIIPKTASMGLNAITYGATSTFNTFAQFSGVGSAVGKSPEIGGEKVKMEKAMEDRWSAEVPRASIDQVTGKFSFDGVRETDTPSPAPSTPTIGKTQAISSNFDRLQLLLSLDTALQLIQADRDCLKRIQTFIRYPGLYGQKVRDAIEEVFIILLQVLSEKHVVPAFQKATFQMSLYKPEENEEKTSVAPLVQFFELVHIGDTIQQMVEVYFDKEMATYIDKKDFLNAVVREKKRFETSLDDAVAQGLNAAVNILMNQVEHIIFTHQDVRDFSPAEGVDLDLRPTKACTEAIEVLVTHCDMLKGSTDKQILEVFHQEVGIRLHGILLKHLKRQIISIEGGFQLISDLNAYHAFVGTLRQPQLTSYFTSLKMVGEIYIVDSPKDLGQLVRDVSRYEGTLSAEDLYECVQRRTDWKRIEKQVEKQLFGLRVADDCTVM